MVRGSLGAVALGVTSTKKYPYYVIPVANLLELKAWKPHQDLLAEGKLVEISDDANVEVIFVSHQWSAFNHPDPSNEQLEALQNVIRKLMQGKTVIKENAFMNLVYHSRVGMSGAEWKEKLPQMFLWIDYVSIPQPGAVIASEAATMSEELKHELDADGDGDISQKEIMGAAEGGANQTTIAAEGGANQTTTIDEQDHRKILTTDEKIRTLIESLKNAVESIPSYIERSSQMWILVPPVKHADLDASVCDFNSWRRRGWCRMEFGAAKLTVGEDMPLMVIKSGVDMSEESVQYFHPCDTFKLQPFKGEFSVDSDRHAVNGTLGKMIAAKTKYYDRPESFDPLLRRLVQCFTPVFVPREDISDVALPDAADPDAPEGSYAPAVGTAVDRMKRFFNWRSEEEEEAWMSESGLNLLTLACSLNDEAAIDELLALPSEQLLKMLDDSTHKFDIKPGSKEALASTTGKTRSEPFGRLMGLYAGGLSPLIAACTFGTTDTLKKVLDACEPRHVEREALGLLGDNMCTFRGCIMSGNVDNLRLILDRYPQFTKMQSVAGGATPLMMSTWISPGQNQKEIMKVLIERGAADAGEFEKQNIFGETVLQMAGRIYDIDPEAMRLLLEAAGESAGDLLAQPIKMTGKFKYVVRPMMSLMALRGDLFARGMKRYISAAIQEEGSTAVHRAAARGDVAMLKLFKEVADVHPASSKLRNSKRKTPLDVVTKAARGAKSDYYTSVLESQIGQGPASPPRKGRGDQVLPH